MKYLAIFICFIACFCSAAGSPVLVDKVVAVVNDEVITLSEFNAIFLPTLEQMNAQKVTGVTKAEVRGKIMSELINEKLLLQEAKSGNRSVSKSELDAAYAKLVAQNGGDAAFKAALQKEGLTDDDIREKINESILKEKIVTDKVKDTIRIDLSSITDYYDKNKDEFKEDKVKYRRILIKAEGEFKAKTDEVMKKLKAGEDFAALAKKYSDDDPIIKEAGGEVVEYVKPRDISEAVSKVLFSLQEGQFSEPVVAGPNIWIVKVDKKEADKVLALSDMVPFGTATVQVRELIFQKLYRQAFAQKMDEYLTGLKKKAVIEIKLGE